MKKCIKKKEDFFIRDVLRRTQSHIFKPHGKKFQSLFFCRFKSNDIIKNREGIRDLCFESELSFISSCCQFSVRKNYKPKSCSCLLEIKKQKEKDILTAFFFTKYGLEKLGFKRPAKLSTITEKEQSPKDVSFWNGMKHRQTRNRLNDPEVEFWESDYKKTVHFLVLVSFDYEKSKLSNKTIQSIISKYGELVFDQQGQRKFILENNKNYPIEWFGFRDGLSKLKLWRKRSTKISKENLSILLDEYFGSYFIVRKYEQHVKNFKCQIKKLSEKIIENLNDEDLTKFNINGSSNPDEIAQLIKEFCEAQVIGRFKDGTLLSRYESRLSKEGCTLDEIDELNKGFDLYLPDSWKRKDLIELESFMNLEEKKEEGSKCPFHSHIRKSNPRNSEVSSSTSYGGDNIKTEIRIARRGIPYDDRTEEEKKSPEDPNHNVGLIFMSYQGSIRNSFEFIITEWVNNVLFPNSITGDEGVDPLIGVPRKGFDQKWNTKWDSPNSKQVKMGFNSEESKPIVTMKGGYYFYAPSIEWLKSL